MCMNISLLPPLSAYLVGLHPLDKQGFLVEIFIRLEPKGHHSNYVSCGWFFCFNSYCYTAFGLNYFYAFCQYNFEITMQTKSCPSENSRACHSSLFIKISRHHLFIESTLVQFLLAPLEFPKLANAQPSNFGPLSIF